jgi:hypothetical protein
MAMACFLLVTFLPLRPLLSFPFFMARISRSTLFAAAGEYFRVDFFFPAEFFLVDLTAIATPSSLVKYVMAFGFLLLSVRRDHT